MAKALYPNAETLAIALREQGEDVITKIFDAIVEGRPMYKDIPDALRLGMASVIGFKGIERTYQGNKYDFAVKYLPIIAFNAVLTAVDLEVEGDVNKGDLGDPDDNIQLFFDACDIFAQQLHEAGESEGETLEAMAAICALVPMNAYFPDSVIEKTLTELVRRVHPEDKEELCDECSAH